jgi:hypothetical protein
LQVMAGVDAGEARTCDQDVEMLQRHRLTR